MPRPSLTASAALMLLIKWALRRYHGTSSRRPELLHHRSRLREIAATFHATADAARRERGTALPLATMTLRRASKQPADAIFMISGENARHDMMMQWAIRLFWL